MVIDRDRCSRMPLNGRIWQELTWSWAYSTGHPASDQKLEAAAKAAWSYSLLCAWTYLDDHESAADLMDHAVQNAFRYFERHPESTAEKLLARIKSVIHRRAKQLATKRSRELSSGSMADMEALLAVKMPSNNEFMRATCSLGCQHSHRR